MKSLEVKLDPRYFVHIDDGLLVSDFFAQYCIKGSARFVIITDQAVEVLYGFSLREFLRERGLRCEMISFPAGEASKSRETKAWLEDELLAMGYGRDTCIIALGGGVVLDLAGFIAATYYRGVDCIFCPTSLLAMVDATIGGKNAVNTAHGKNLIGTFYQPKAVFIDPTVLKTLDEEEFQSGMAELIKHSILFDQELFDQLSEAEGFDSGFLLRSSALKAAIVEADVFDQGKRNLLNFGHTVGHALEGLSGFTIPHGKAVAFGIMVESYVSKSLGLLSSEDCLKITELLHKFKTLPSLGRAYDFEEFRPYLLSDKKTINVTPQYILMEAIGVPKVEGSEYTHSIEDALLKESIAICMKLCIKEVVQC